MASIRIRERVSERAIIRERSEAVILRQGVMGPPGPSGNSITVSFPAQLQWVVNHNLGRYPSVQVLNFASQVAIAEIQHNSSNQFRVVFVVPTAGVVIYS